MKWFKHQSTARNDERIARLEDKCGLEGYGFYFKMLEIVAEGVDSSDRCEVTYSISRWGRQANISTKKFLFLARCCHDVGLMFAQRCDDDMIVKIPNLLKHRDNHTTNLQATSKQDKDTYKEEKDKDEDIKNIHPVAVAPCEFNDDLKEAITEPKKPKQNTVKNYSEEFNNAFAAYPKRKGDNPKKKAFEAWGARLKEGSTESEMIAGVGRYLAFCQAEGNIGTQYVKQAATFFGPDKAFLESWEITQKSPSSSPHRNPGFIKQPTQRPIYTYPGGDSDAIDSTAIEIQNEQARL